MGSVSQFNPVALRQLRQRLGLSLRAFAAPLGYTHNMVHQVENGRTRPSLDFLERVAQVYGVNLQEFFRVARQGNGR